MNELGALEALAGEWEGDEEEDPFHTDLLHHTDRNTRRRTEACRLEL